jgi:hypothetical protein
MLLHVLFCISTGNMPKKYGSDANASDFNPQLFDSVLGAWT